MVSGHLEGSVLGTGNGYNKNLFLVTSNEVLLKEIFGI